MGLGFSSDTGRGAEDPGVQAHDPPFWRKEGNPGTALALQTFKLINHPSYDRERSWKDAADLSVFFVPLPSCSLCPFVCFLLRHLQY